MERVNYRDFRKNGVKYCKVTTITTGYVKTSVYIVDGWVLVESKTNRFSI